MIFEKVDKNLTLNYLQNQWLKHKDENQLVEGITWNNWSCDICSVRPFNIRCTMASGVNEKINCCIVCLNKDITTNYKNDFIVPNSSVNYYYTKEELMMQWERMEIKSTANKSDNDIVETDEEVKLKRKRNHHQKVKGR